VSDGPRASALNVEPKAMRKGARRAAAVHGAEGAVLIVVAGGEVHLGCTHSLEFLGAVLEKALNDWRAAATRDPGELGGASSRHHPGVAQQSPADVEAKHIPKLAALTALAGGRKTPPR
jgi:hypothetical protein